MQEGTAHFTLDGAPLAREGDRVTCGKDGKAYSIAGGVQHFMLDTLAAGSLDSVSTCPCGARLINSSFGISYRSDNGASWASPASAPDVAARPLAARPSWGAPPTSATNSLLEEEEEEEALEHAGIVLRLGLFFDGTGNNQANSAATEGCYAVNLGMSHEVGEDIRQYCASFGYDGKGSTPDNSYGNGPTNVARLHDLYPDHAEERLPPGTEVAYIPVYIEGIGTRSGVSDALYSQASGKGGTGVVARVEQMPALALAQLRLLQDANPGLMIRRIEIDLFGFSRGAAAARHCANDLLKGPDSLLARAMPVGTPGFIETFAWRHRSDFALNFIGLYDTVAGIVSLSDGDFSPHNAKNPGLNLRLTPGMARQVVHLVARDEYRHNFSLTETVQDIQLPGCHSDIGGGYLPLAREKLLLSKPDSSIEHGSIANERSTAYARTKQRYYQEAPHWLTFVPPEGLDIVTWSVPTQHRAPNTQAEKRVYAAIASEREVRGDLSLVYLHIMREMAVRAGVAFEEINDRHPHFSLPTELQPIAAKLQAFALREIYTPLTAEENALLRRRYIHLSANWNAARGLNNSTLDALFINRPANGRRRQEHPNE